ncbi:MAG: prolipoprotein diacylglyceryl transferase [Deltaproteobacteria bacterium]|nr:prolipoprotein diacylglyceryl transferase [Deltaproteobacteria bacterium]
MHPVLFEIPTPWGGQYIYSYGVMLTLSLLMGLVIVGHFGTKKESFHQEILANCYVVTAVSAIVGSRILYVITNLESFSSPIQWLDLRSGGLVAYGGFLGGALGAASYLRLKKRPFLAFADAAAPALAFGLSCTRVGCYLYGCDFGVRLSRNAPEWLKAIGTFPRWSQFGDRLRGSPAFIHHVDLYNLAPDATHAYPVHPTQLYEVVAGMLLLIICLIVWRRRLFRGQVILVLALGYGVWRFFLEYIRDDPERGAAFGFSTSQLISILLVPSCALAYVQLRKATF